MQQGVEESEEREDDEDDEDDEVDEDDKENSNELLEKIKPFIAQLPYLVQTEIEEKFTGEDLDDVEKTEYQAFLKERGQWSDEIHTTLHRIKKKGELLSASQEHEKAQFTHQYITLRDKYNRGLIDFTDFYDPETFLEDMRQMEEEISTHLEANNNHPNIEQLIRGLPDEMQTVMRDHFNDASLSKDERERDLETLKEKAPIYLKASHEIDSLLPSVTNTCKALTVHVKVGAQAEQLLQNIKGQDDWYQENLALWNNQYSPRKFLEDLRLAEGELDVLQAEKLQFDENTVKKERTEEVWKKQQEETDEAKEHFEVVITKDPKKTKQEQEASEEELEKINETKQQKILAKLKKTPSPKNTKTVTIPKTQKELKTVRTKAEDDRTREHVSDEEIDIHQSEPKKTKITRPVHTKDSPLDSNKDSSESKETEIITYSFAMQGALKELLTTMRLSHDVRSIKLFNELYILMRQQKMTRSNFFDVKWLQRKDQKLYRSMRTLFEVQKGRKLEDIFEACVSTKSWNRVLQAKPSELLNSNFDAFESESDQEDTMKIPTEEVKSADALIVNTNEDENEANEPQNTDFAFDQPEQDLEPIMVDTMIEVDPTDAKFLNDAPEDRDEAREDTSELVAKLHYPNQWSRDLFAVLEQIEQSDITQLHRNIPFLLESLEGAADVEYFMENVRQIHPASYDLLYDITERSSANQDFLDNLYEQLQTLDPSIVTTDDDPDEDLDDTADDEEPDKEEDPIEEDTIDEVDEDEMDNEMDNELSRHPWPQSFNKYIDRLDDEIVEILDEYYPHILEVAEASEDFAEFYEVLSSISEIANILHKAEYFLSALFDTMGNTDQTKTDEIMQDLEEDEEAIESQDLEPDLEDQEMLEEDEIHDPKLSDEIAELMRDYLPYLIQFAHESETFDDFLDRIVSEESFPEELIGHVGLLRGIFEESRAIIDDENETEDDIREQATNKEHDDELETNTETELDDDAAEAEVETNTETELDDDAAEAEVQINTETALADDEELQQEIDLAENTEENDLEKALPDNLDTAPLEELGVMLSQSLVILEQSDDKSRFIETIRNNESVGTWLQEMEINHHGFKDFFIQSLWQQKLLAQNTSHEHETLTLDSFLQNWLNHLSQYEKKEILSALFLLLKMRQNQEASLKNLCLNSKKWRKMVTKHPLFFFMLQALDTEILEQVLEIHNDSEQDRKQALSLFDLLHYIQNIFKKSHCYFELKNLRLIHDQYLYLSDEELDKWSQELNNYIQPHQIFWGELRYKGANKMCLETSSFKKTIPDYLENAQFKADYQDSLELEYVHINAL